MNKVKFTLLTAGLVLAMAFTLSCSSDGGGEPSGSGGSNSFRHCLINEQCLDGPFTSKECGDLGGLPSNSCKGDGDGAGGDPSSSSGGGEPSGGGGSSSVEQSYFYGTWASVDGSGATVRWTFTSNTATFYVGGGYYAEYSISEWQPVSSTGNDSPAYPFGFKIIMTQTGGNIVLDTKYFFASSTSNNHMAGCSMDVLYGNGVPKNGVYLIYQRQ